jgi:repressor LexA
MNADELSEKQIEILAFIKKYMGVAHYAPTYKEICEMAGLASTSNVHYHLQKLRAAGYVTWTERRARTLRVLDGHGND